MPVSVDGVDEMEQRLAPEVALGHGGERLVYRRHLRSKSPRRGPGSSPMRKVKTGCASGCPIRPRSDREWCAGASGPLSLPARNAPMVMLVLPAFECKQHGIVAVRSGQGQIGRARRRPGFSSPFHYPAGGAGNRRWVRVHGSRLRRITPILIDPDSAGHERNGDARARTLLQIASGLALLRQHAAGEASTAIHQGAKHFLARYGRAGGHCSERGRCGAISPAEKLACPTLMPIPAITASPSICARIPAHFFSPSRTSSWASAGRARGR